MVEIAAIPASGQFVAIWLHNGKLWAGTFLVEGDRVLAYSDDLDDFSQDYFAIDWLKPGYAESNPLQVRFFVADAP